jgi:hypothetical protein
MSPHVAAVEPFKIPAPSHLRRNLWLLAGLFTLTAALAGYYSRLGKTDAREINRLESFRSQYAQSCDADEFAAPASPILRESYLRSAALRAAVDRAQGALEEGASCQEVLRRLRSAEFPMAAPTPTIVVHPR